MSQMQGFWLTDYQNGIITGNRVKKWFNSPVNAYRGTLKNIRQYIPDFERHGFGTVNLFYDKYHE